MQTIHQTTFCSFFCGTTETNAHSRSKALHLFCCSTYSNRNTHKVASDISFVLKHSPLSPCQSFSLLANQMRLTCHYRKENLFWKLSGGRCGSLSPVSVIQGTAWFYKVLFSVSPNWKMFMPPFMRISHFSLFLSS